MKYRSVVNEEGNIVLVEPGKDDVSLRDLFAISAMEGILAHYSPDSGGVAMVASTAYRMADEMLKAREAEQ